MDTISQIAGKIKLFISTHIEELGVSSIIILVGFSCFYLGRISVGTLGSGNQGISIERAPTASSTASAQKVSEIRVGASKIESSPAASAAGPIVASKNGKRYYYPGCSGISRISPANIVHFASALEAERFGLTLAANCTATK